MNTQLNRCKCGKMTLVRGTFCSTKCRNAYADKSFKTYAVKINLIMNSPDDFEIVKSMINLADEFRDIHGASMTFHEIREIDFESVKGRYLDIIDEVHAVLTEKEQIESLNKTKQST